MTKNGKIVGLTTIGAVALIIVLWFGKDWLQSIGRNIECDDGPRQTIDLRDFITQFSSYSFELQVDKARFAGKLEPAVFQQMSEALQQANEFRKFLVAGYNACAVTKTQYAHFGARFQTMESLARQIDSLSKQAGLTGADRALLTELVRQYIALAQKGSQE